MGIRGHCPSKRGVKCYLEPSFFQSIIQVVQNSIIWFSRVIIKPQAYIRSVRSCIYITRKRERIKTVQIKQNRSVADIFNSLLSLQMLMFIVLGIIRTFPKHRSVKGRSVYQAVIQTPHTSPCHFFLGIVQIAF